MTFWQAAGAVTTLSAAVLFLVGALGIMEEDDWGGFWLAVIFALGFVGCAAGFVTIVTNV